MLAAVVDRYGPPDVIEVRDVPPPAAARGRVRVRVRAASLNPLDVKLRAGALRPFMRLRFPAILGFDLAGEIESIGPGVNRFAVGDRVYGRIDARTGGTHAELVLVRPDVLDQIPRRLSFEQAAALPLAGMTAVQALREQARLRAGQSLLVIGGAGGVGSLAIQVGRAFGASVDAVVSAGGADLARGLGATRVFDPAAGEPRQGRYDAVFDTVSSHLEDHERLLADAGVYVTTGFSPGLAVRRLFGRLRSRRRIAWVISRPDGNLMRRLSALVNDGTLDPVIDSTWPLARIGDAYRKLEEGHARGKLVITIP
jgi:NADPH:quinone reductase-like Zn-dependent oxidoreductase